MDTKTLRTSTILIASGGKTQLFRSRAEMPPNLRRRLEQSMNSGTAATVLIADQRGRDEILKLLRGEPSALRHSATGALRRRFRKAAIQEEEPIVETHTPWLHKRWVRALIAFLIPAAIGATFYAVLLSPK